MARALALAEAGSSPDVDVMEARQGLALGLNANSQLAEANEQWELIVDSFGPPAAHMLDDLSKAEGVRLAYAHNLAALGDGAGALRHFGHTCAPFFCAEWTGHHLSPAIAAALEPGSPAGTMTPTPADAEPWSDGSGVSKPQARAFRGVLGAKARAALHDGESGYWRANAALGDKHDTGYISWYAPADAPPRNLMDQIALKALLPTLPEEARAKVVGVEYWAHRMDPKAFEAVRLWGDILRRHFDGLPVCLGVFPSFLI